jgi:hypothetical protein
VFEFALDEARQAEAVGGLGAASASIAGKWP